MAEVIGDRGWWEVRAACRTAPDPDAFFEIEDAAQDGRVPDPVRVAAALDLCRRCPIREECGRRGAESYGIWGGLTASERGLRPVRPLAPAQSKRRRLIRCQRCHRRAVPNGLRRGPRGWQCKNGEACERRRERRRRR